MTSATESSFRDTPLALRHTRGYRADLDTRLDEWLDFFEQADPDDETTMSDDAKARLEDLGYLQD
ncbi:hypothetical protein [Halapricum hydrolyticum]|uniref:Uncharacterized protein n=1 Tax=Halapricum hydrolyticum TaxID=2979991 RepID=A0AAE3LGC2_9EURY|nr:hypothetical protein [Halapricum hydrolyticum]MCU4719629.1 hypothetical protein [Halapricum hydrolyticum]MCU4728522.1 hypothetical protein [Halapricum hydrolyticum]